MKYQEMKESHGLQINAMVAYDFEAMRSLTGIEDYTWNTHQDVWAATGMVTHGLFGSLPGTSHCLTQIKDRIDNDYSSYLEKADWKWAENLNLVKNKLIPAVMEEDTVLTREQLEEFSRLQLLAHYPEEKS